ncbi:MAG TPA: hypothetical protein VLM85_15415 [Polyangiaceae bacterium]|nr:hypothetical protein [Polyangiaceae bacterium]
MTDGRSLLGAEALLDRGDALLELLEPGVALLEAAPQLGETRAPATGRNFLEPAGVFLV